MHLIRFGAIEVSRAWVRSNGKAAPERVSLELRLTGDDLALAPEGAGAERFVLEYYPANDKLTVRPARCFTPDQTQEVKDRASVKALIEKASQETWAVERWFSLSLKRKVDAAMARIPNTFAVTSLLEPFKRLAGKYRNLELTDLPQYYGGLEETLQALKQAVR